MKKFIALLLAAVLTLALAACGSKNDTNTNDNSNDTNNDNAPAAVTGTVATDGSTSMEKVIGALSESFMANNADATVTYNPTGSGAGITAASGVCVAAGVVTISVGSAGFVAHPVKISIIAAQSIRFIAFPPCHVFFYISIA